MNIVALRDRLHKNIDLADNKLLKMLEALIEAYQTEETDWWDDLSKEEQEEIDEGLKQADQGQLIDHSEVMKTFDKWR